VAGKRARAGASASGAVRLVYLDQCEVHRHPRLTRLWRRRGTKLRVPAAGEDARFTVYGALDYASGRLLWQIAPRKCGGSFVAFLDHLAAALPTGQILVVLDNVGYHKRLAARRGWVAHHARTRPLWLPAYAPQLNRIERVWRHLKDKLSNHRWWADLPALERATGTLLDALRDEFHRPGHGLRLIHNFSKVG
jgi:transposase